MCKGCAVKHFKTPEDETSSGNFTCPFCREDCT